MDSGHANTIPELSRAVGRGTSTVHRWIHDSRWPFGATPPWPIDDVKAWMTATFTRGPEAGDDAEEDLPPRAPLGSMLSQVQQLDPLKQVRILKATQELHMLRRQNAILDGHYVDRDEARREIRAVIHETRRALLAECKTMAETLEAMGALVPGQGRAVKEVLVRRIESICHRFAQGMTSAIEDTIEQPEAGPRKRGPKRKPRREPRR